MSEFAIRVENLGKEYRIGGSSEGYKTLRESLSGLALGPARALSSLARRGSGAAAEEQKFWALRDVSFDVRKGEVVGIIGRNGAGKSTLLKVLSRITEPTQGRIRMRGRVGSLLEVGTGFHPELSGRENIFLNGAILGMPKSLIEKKFDEIVDFAEVGKFIDTPVKRYSSGMYLKLAFAVAAYLEPEILVVDEVLAVGDAGFQKKCLNKMEQVGQEGRTVLFVSHNMPAVTRLCQRVILLDQGSVLADGSSQQVVSKYLQSGVGTTAAREWSAKDAPGNSTARLLAVRARDESGNVSEAMDIRRPIGIEVEFEVTTAGRVLVPNFHVYNEEGICVFIAADQDPAWKRRPRPVGRYSSTAWIPGNFLAEGFLIVSAALSTLDPVEVHFFERDAVAFQVVDSLDGDSARGDFAGPMPGVVRPLLRWQNDILGGAESSGSASGAADVADLVTVPAK